MKDLVTGADIFIASPDPKLNYVQIKQTVQGEVPSLKGGVIVGSLVKGMIVQAIGGNVTASAQPTSGELPIPAGEDPTRSVLEQSIQMSEESQKTVNHIRAQEPKWLQKAFNKVFGSAEDSPARKKIAIRGIQSPTSR